MLNAGISFLGDCKVSFLGEHKEYLKHVLVRNDLSVVVPVLETGHSR